MRSPVPDRPGLLIRDPHGFSEATLIIPAPLVPLLQFFDGHSSDLDLRQALVQLTGELQVGEIERHLIETLSEAGFLVNEIYERLRDQRFQEFAASPTRLAAHAGGAYPETAEEMKAVFDEYMKGAGPPVSDGLCGIAAPHVSPEGGWESYRDAYSALHPELAGRTFIILGTSHYGAPDRFGMTRKDYVTPLGRARTNTDLAERLASRAPGAVLMEDYCHATEHSIEFQVAFLQHIYGPEVRILPILVGSFHPSIAAGTAPENNDEVRRFFGELAEINARHKEEIFWVLGVDMAHIGARYGDRQPALAHEGQMLAVTARDKDRIAAIGQGDSAAYWDLVKEGGDDELKWCGSAPFYTFLKAVPEARGEMLRYQHWQIDPQSVVSFAAMAFRG